MQAKRTAVVSTASVIRLAPSANAAFVVASLAESLGRKRLLSSETVCISSTRDKFARSSVTKFASPPDLGSQNNPYNLLVTAETLMVAQLVCQPIKRIMASATMHSRQLRKWPHIMVFQSRKHTKMHIREYVLGGLLNAEKYARDRSAAL